MNETETGFRLMEPASPESLVPDYGLWPWFVAGGILLAVVFAFWMILKKRATAIDPQAARKAAFAEALEALNTSNPDSARNAAIQSSLILRKYLAQAASDPALYETHEEFVSRRDSLQALAAEARSAAETGFTKLASLKYAPEIPDADPAGVVSESKALLETLHHGFAA
jgi:hypothetical protein